MTKKVYHYDIPAIIITTVAVVWTKQRRAVVTSPGERTDLRFPVTLCEYSRRRGKRLCSSKKKKKKLNPKDQNKSTETLCQVSLLLF